MGLALKSDGTVRGWGGVNVPAGVSGVTAIAVGGFGLLITTNPPQPVLAGTVRQDGNVVLTSPVSVSGYVLEAADDFRQPFTEVSSYTNSFLFTNAGNPGLSVPMSSSRKFFRLMKP